MGISPRKGTPVRSASLRPPPAPKMSFGNVVWYAQGVMEATAQWRHLDLSDYVDGIAMISPADIGKTVWLKRPGHNWDGPFLSVDAARRGDMPNVILRNGEVAEVGYQTAVRWGMVNGTTVKIWRYENVIAYIGDEPPKRYITPVDYAEWWDSVATYTCKWQAHPYFVFPSSWNFRDGTIIHHSEFINKYFYNHSSASRVVGMYE